MSQDPISAPQGHQPLPQEHFSKAGLHLPPAQALQWADAPVWPQPLPIPSDVPDTQSYT